MNFPALQGPILAIPRGREWSRQGTQCRVPSRSDFSKPPNFLAVPRLSRRLWNSAATTTLLFHRTFLAAQMKPHPRVTLARITESSITGQLWKPSYTLPSPVGSTAGSWRAFLISKSWAVPRSAVCSVSAGLGRREDCGMGLWRLGGLAKLLHTVQKSKQDLEFETEISKIRFREDHGFWVSCAIFKVQSSLISECQPYLSF